MRPGGKNLIAFRLTNSKVLQLMLRKPQDISFMVENLVDREKEDSLMELYVYQTRSD